MYRQIAFTEKGRDVFLGEFSGKQSKLKMEFVQLEELLIGLAQIMLNDFIQRHYPQKNRVKNPTTLVSKQFETVA